jgi:LPS export ABC transporter protein LptC/lipopolysaccharide transport protein LptA
MRVEKIFTYRLIRALRAGIPLVLLILISVFAWNFWSRRVAAPEPQAAQALPQDLAVLTEGFSFSRTEEGRTLFTVRAQTNLGFRDSRNMLENVEVIVYGQTDAEPVRRIRSTRCDYDQQTNDIHFTGNVQVQLDDKTHGRTEELTYNHVERKIHTDRRVELEQPGMTTATANSLEYVIDTSLLKLVGEVELVTADGNRLVAGSALLAQRENRLTLGGGVLLGSVNGTVQGAAGYADLESGTFQVRKVILEGGVRAESKGHTDDWSLEADWLQTLLSVGGNAERVEARGKARLVKANADTTQSLIGAEIDATLDSAGNVDVVEARNGARMVMGADRTLSSNRIRAGVSGTVTTDAESVLELGASRINGTEFTITQGDIVDFRTANRATLQSAGRRTSADQTEARFDTRTNTFLELIQTGNFEFQENALSGEARSAHLTDQGSVITLNGPAWVQDAAKRIEADNIALNQKENSFVATGKVRTVTKQADQPVLVTAERAEGNADAVTYTTSVQLWRGPVWIRAHKLEATPKENRYHAEGEVQSTVESVRAKSDKLDFDERQRIAHYTGRVSAQKQDMTLRTDDMTVKAEGDEVSEIVAVGNVVLTRTGQSASGEKAVYDATQETVVLTGRNARFVDEKELVAEGPVLVVHTSGEKMSVQSDGPQRTTSKYKVKRSF